MMGPSLITKLIRAEEHLKTVHDAVVTFLATRPYEVVTQRAGNQIIACVVYRHQPPDRLLRRHDPQPSIGSWSPRLEPRGVERRSAHRVSDLHVSDRVLKRG